MYKKLRTQKEVIGFYNCEGWFFQSISAEMPLNISESEMNIFFQKKNRFHIKNNVLQNEKNTFFTIFSC